jgi:membrane fusion protein (multidrug efflux system)
MNSISITRQLFISGLLLSMMAGCGEKKPDPQAAGAPPPSNVAVITVAPEQVAVITELPGRVEAIRVAEVRARVAGIVQKRVFTEGSEVQAGDVLYRIDAAPFQASVNSAQAVLARAEANLGLANTKLNRYRGLVDSNAISKQEFDDLQSAQKLAAADVASAQAALDVARLNLSYATVTAPISGRTGRALVTEGALVGQGDATNLAVVQQIDSIYVTLVQSSVEMRRLQQIMAQSNNGKVKAKLTLVMEDGKVYNQPGNLLFSEVTVDPSSGSVTLRAAFPNPQRTLLPGMYVRVRLEQGVRGGTITVPQQAVIRTADGALVMTVGADNKVAPRPVKTDGAYGTNWIISEGLKKGDLVIVEGLQKVKPGATVKPSPWVKPEDASAAPAAAAPASAASQQKN